MQTPIIDLMDWNNLSFKAGVTPNYQAEGKLIKVTSHWREERVIRREWMPKDFLISHNSGKTAMAIIKPRKKITLSMRRIVWSSRTMLISGNWITRVVVALKLKERNRFYKEGLSKSQNIGNNLEMVWKIESNSSNLSRILSWLIHTKTNRYEVWAL